MTELKPEARMLVEALREERPGPDQRARMGRRLLAAGAFAATSASAEAAAAAALKASAGANVAAKIGSATGSLFPKLASLPLAAKVVTASIVVSSTVAVPVAMRWTSEGASRPTASQEPVARASTETRSRLDPSPVAPSPEGAGRGSPEGAWRAVAAEEVSPERPSRRRDAPAAEDHATDAPVPRPPRPSQAARPAPVRGQDPTPGDVAQPRVHLRASPEPGAPPSDSRLGEESALLIQALHAMAEGRHEAAAHWLDRHQRQFSSEGQLTPERQRIRRQLTQQSLRKKGSVP